MIKLNHTRIWFRWQTALLRNLWPSTLQAASAMQQLNSHARRRDSGQIYPLKSQLVKLFYEQGYCQRLTVQEQVLKCHARWHWYSPEFEDDHLCPRCGGSGIYKRHYLFLFHFVINGHAFGWHQPVALCPWLSLSKAEIGGNYDNTLEGRIIRDVDTQAALVAQVRNYLRRNGIRPTFNGVSFYRSFRHDFLNWFETTGFYRLKRRAEQTHARVHYILTDKYPDDYIPF